MKFKAVIFLLLATLTGCRSDGIKGYWEKNGIDYGNVDAARERFAEFAEMAVNARETDAFDAMDALFDKLKEDEVAYFLYTDWMTTVFYVPVSPCRSEALYGKAVERFADDGILSEGECAMYRQRLAWMEFNRQGEAATVPGVTLDGRRTLVLVLDMGCPSCKEALSRLAADERWAEARRVAICCNHGTAPAIAAAEGWEFYFPEYPTDVFDLELLPIYFVVSADGTVELSYQTAR